MSPSPTVSSKIRQYISDNFLYTRRDAILGDDEQLLERRIIDSMGMVELVTYIGEEFGIEVADDEITEANFGTVSSIVCFVSSKAMRNEAAA